MAGGRAPATGRFSVALRETGIGKSFLALDLALFIASGKCWHGRDVEMCDVVYVLGEGASGIRQRVAAWRQVHGTDLRAGGIRSRTRENGRSAKGQTRKI